MKNIMIDGAVYEGVKRITVSDTEGGKAVFVEESEIPSSKHGRWRTERLGPVTPGGITLHGHECSECKGSYSDYSHRGRYKFCPYCGATMENDDPS